VTDETRHSVLGHRRCRGRLRVRFFHALCDLLRTEVEENIGSRDGDGYFVDFQGAGIG
jgi:hypothetical protein